MKQSYNVWLCFKKNTYHRCHPVWGVIGGFLICRCEAGITRSLRLFDVNWTRWGSCPNRSVVVTGVGHMGAFHGQLYFLTLLPQLNFFLDLCWSYTSCCTWCSYIFYPHVLFLCGIPRLDCVVSIYCVGKIYELKKAHIACCLFT